MNITHLKKHTKQNTINKFKKVILLNSEKKGKPIFVYENAKIELRKIKIKDLLPLQLYQLKSSSQLVQNLYKIFQKKYKADIFNMDGYFTYISDDKRYELVPPIVENVKNQKGEMEKIIIDGLHRILLAKKLKKEEIVVVVVENIPEKLILPVAPNSWEEIKVMKIAPESKYRRNWLIPPDKGYLYYRNFQSVFQNVGQPHTSKVDK